MYIRYILSQLYLIVLFYTSLSICTMMPLLRCWGPAIDSVLSLNPRNADYRWIADDWYNSYHSENLTLHSADRLILLVINKPYCTRVFIVVYSKHIDSSQETCTYVELQGVASITLYVLF